jgi:hypothetical protein
MCDGVRGIESCRTGVVVAKEAYGVVAVGVGAYPEGVGAYPEGVGAKGEGAGVYPDGARGGGEEKGA